MIQTHDSIGAKMCCPYNTIDSCNGLEPLINSYGLNEPINFFENLIGSKYKRAD